MKEEKEVWKDIEGYEGKYMVSNIGNVKSLKRTVWDNRGYYRTVPEKILKAVDNGDGYLFVYLCKEGIKKKYYVHQLVGNAFISNPQGYKEVNHISEDKTDCRAENLEFCSRSYNINYGTRNKRASEKLRGRKQSEEHIKKRVEKLSKPVIAINKVSGLIVEFKSVHEAERQLGIDHASIIKCCKGKYKSSGGFYFFYADDDTE